MTATPLTASERPRTAEKVPLVDLSAEYASINGEIDAAIQDVIARTAFVRGPFARAFESQWATYCGASHAVGCANGTVAIELALRALGIGPGDEVITTPLTFIATVESIVHAGATPVLAEIDPRTCNLSPEATKAAITPRTKAIVPVALYGQPADMGAFRHIADTHGLLVVEDSAQAQGAAWAGRRTGSDGVADATTFSFYPGKNLGAYGDAGAVTTADPALADRILRLSDHGRAEKYTHDQVGFNSRLDGIQAAVLSAKLPRLDAWNAARRRLAQRYDTLLAGAVQRGLLRTVEQAPDARGVYHLYVVRVAAPPAGAGRDAVLASLRDAGIEAGVHYPVPLHLQPALAHLGYGDGAFPEAERASREALSLPIFPLMTEAQQDRVVAALLAAVGASGA
ncbi:MAG: Bacillosamine/Legionaminic acid biosynthesis aminotransferase PglE; 4-keto-6-deoxy-N-Acetyl-D-hexosaminyl-(Lipid carrier) aminotransferase [uncultured Chloroflexi bacterium]|uniref:Bacillosamine/Legionaminic acid biosynthesis aminotransferase PglE 4-keto-6-deoxy-N-Acetyl-D-hexosaminyl-(Lipid carrier) aminotransferase n=1 Tax=uncultured Chloroflexota bacterium TaxID=166587 RepID=A0A6J4JK99_9CHLR|nr:MAG: Bacillosamine/Legionaminic acid biosynthesis aminotransferase PglE; 4-keto-6-deoxy-N-Acetyl-D-hexosaminyl-(Lipid carrier) aminotransferase [uncultured Chloroflexota bacterium]